MRLLREVSVYTGHPAHPGALDDRAFALSQSRLAREQMERRFGLDATYGALARALRDWIALVEKRGA